VVGVGGHLLHIADVEAHGEVLLTVSPNAVSVHRQPPGGSPRNAWATDVAALEDLGSRVRLSTGAPLPMTVELTTEATRELEVSVGSSIWVAVKATEIGVEGGRSPVGAGAPLRRP
jgi:molybdopterin-binding protein